MRMLVLLLAAVWVAPGYASQSSLAGAAAGAAEALAKLSRRPVELLVFGGENNQVFLGCLTCAKEDSRSVLNSYGQYGSRYSSTSVVNSYSQYGSPYALESACNRYALKAPVIVDVDGNYYGQLTINQHNPERTGIATVRQWIAGICAR